MVISCVEYDVLMLRDLGWAAGRGKCRGAVKPMFEITVLDSKRSHKRCMQPLENAITVEI